MEYIEKYLQLKRGEDFVARRLLKATNSKDTEIESSDDKYTGSKPPALFMCKMKVIANCRLGLLFKQGVDVVEGDIVQVVAVHQVGLLASGWIAGRLVRNGLPSFFPLSLLQLEEQL